MACNGSLKRFPLVASCKVERMSPPKLIEIGGEVVEMVDHGGVVGLARRHAPTLLFIIQVGVLTERRIHLVAALGLLLARDRLDPAEISFHGTGLKGSHECGVVWEVEVTNIARGGLLCTRLAFTSYAYSRIFGCWVMSEDTRSVPIS
jgi:hypothetical protein